MVHPPSKDGHFKEEPFSLFYSNISSLSSHAKNYIFSLPTKMSALALAECHYEDELSVTNLFRTNGFKVAYSPAERSNVLNHGGELVGTRCHIASRLVPTTILELVRDYFNTNLRFASLIVQFKIGEMLFIVPYFWVGEGFSERNQTIIRQISMVRRSLGLPFFAIGDWNITFKEFVDSVWPEFLDVHMIDPIMPTTTSLAPNRPIEYAMISNPIRNMHHLTKPIYTVPW